MREEQQCITPDCYHNSACGGIHFTKCGHFCTDGKFRLQRDCWILSKNTRNGPRLFLTFFYLYQSNSWLVTVSRGLIQVLQLHRLLVLGHRFPLVTLGFAYCLQWNCSNPSKGNKVRVNLNLWGWKWPHCTTQATLFTSFESYNRSWFLTATMIGVKNDQQSFHQMQGLYPTISWMLS